MFGTLRLLLAALVVYFHSGGRIFGQWVGVSAVVVFFIISGYAMTGLVTRRFAAPNSNRLFFAERLLRLAPQYYFWLAASFLATFVFKVIPIKPELIIPYDVAAYILVLPLGLQFYLGLVHMLVMPQATTLAIEILIYLTLPLFVRRRYVSYSFGFSAVVIYYLSSLGILEANIYTYYMFPGPIIFFLLGHWMYQSDWKALAFFTPLLLLGLLIGVGRPFTAELLWGVVFGVPPVMGLCRLKPNAFDSALGNASYGCFLCHVIFLDAVTSSGLVDKLLIFPCALLLSIGAGYASYYLVERPFVSFRRGLRSTKLPDSTSGRSAPSGQI